MKTSVRILSPDSKQGFNLAELLVVMAILLVLGGMMIPALAAPKSRSTSLGCLSGLREMQKAWAMYRDDNGDVLLPNAPAAIPSSQAWCPTGYENWGDGPARIDVNTNFTLYTNTLIWPYLNSTLGALKCPADVVPAAAGPRLRSRSMNGQMGAFYLASLASQDGLLESGFKSYSVGSDITAPPPAMAFIFLDEHPCSIQDGYLQIDSAPNGGWPDIPASYHEGGCGFSFADGHCEIHQWQTTNLMIPVVQGTALHDAAGGASNPDWVWFQQRATSPE